MTFNRSASLSCRECLDVLERYVSDGLDAGTAQALEDHLLECEECFAAYVELAGIRPYESVEQIDERFRIPADLLVRFVETHRQLINEMVGQLNSGASLVVEEQGTWQRDRLVGVIAEKLGGKAVRAAINPAVPARVQARTLLLDDATAVPYLAYLRADVLTGPTVEWINAGRPPRRVRRYVIGWGDIDGLGRAVLSRERFRKDGPVGEAFLVACAFGAVGVPVPVSLLGKVSQQSPQDLPFLREPPALFVSMDPSSPIHPRFIRPVSEGAAERALGESDGERQDAMVRWQLHGIKIAGEEEQGAVLSVLSRTVQRGLRNRALRLLEEESVRTFMERAEDSWARLAWARILESLREYRQAREILEEALRADPENVYLRHSLGDLLCEMGDPEKGTEVLQGVLERDPENVYALQTLGRRLARTAPSRAREYLRRALERSPGNVYVLHALGMFEVTRGDYDAAAQTFGQVLSVDPDNPAALNSLAEMEARRGRFAEAERLIGAALRSDPGNPHHAVVWAKIRKERGHLLPAQEVIERPLQEVWLSGGDGPDRFELLRKTANVHVLTTLGDILIERGRFTEAEHWLQMALRLDRTTETTTALFDLYVKAGRLEEAQGLYDGIPEEEQRLPHVQAILARLLLARGADQQTLESAAMILREVLHRHWPNPVVSNQLGRVLARLGRLPDARLVFGETLGLGLTALSVTDRIATLNTWAQVEAESGEMDQAERLFRDSLGLDSENAYTLASLGRFLRDRGRTAEGLSYLNEARRLGYDPPWVIGMLPAEE